MRVMIFGHTGLLGSHLKLAFGSDDIIHIAGGDGFNTDVTKSQILLNGLTEIERVVGESSPDVVINCAGYTNMDKAEAEPEQALMVNAIGAANVARAAMRFAKSDTLRMVYVSTDAVFDGLSGSFNEGHPPSAVGAYSASKRAGEVAVQAICGSRCLIVRAAHLYGHGGKNNASKWAGKLLAGESICADDRRVVTPSWAGSVAERIVWHIRQGDTGTVHATAKRVSWFRFAQRMAARLNVPTSLVVAKSFDGPAPRPMNSTICSYNFFTLPDDDLDVYCQEVLTCGR